MTTHKIVSVLETYAEYLKKGYGCSPRQLTPPEYQSPVVSPERMREHLLWMIYRVTRYLLPSGEINDLLKAHRWLGYIQGELRAMQEFSISQLRDQSRSD